MSRGLHISTDPSQWGFKGKNYLFTIGIDEYAHWKALNNAVKDVDDIVHVLTTRYQFQTSNVIKLRNGDATEDGIRDELIRVKKTITEEDNLVVCFSGHGYYDEDLEEGYWVPVDAGLNKPSDYISNSDLLKWIRSIKTHHTLILIDSCFSGTLVSQSRSDVLSEKYPSSRVFASGRKELVDDGSPGDNSPFAKAVLSALNRNVSRVMRATDLISSVIKQVEANAGQEPVEGRIKDARDEGGEFVFHLKVTEEEIWHSVVSANTSLDYKSYIDYFPDGEHAHEARNLIRRLTDDDDWKRTLSINSKSSLTEYLESHPSGSHYDEAYLMLEQLEEEGEWQKIKTRSSISGYLNYLRRYPDGKYVKEANRQIALEKSEMQSEDQDELDLELSGVDHTARESEEDKTEYKRVVKKAELLFAEGNYAESIVNYEFAIGLYQIGFYPESSFVNERLKRAKRGVKYAHHLRDGKAAVKEGENSVALEHFLAAQKIEDTVKVRDWIDHVSGEIKSDGKVEKRGGAKPKSKRSCQVIIMLGVLFVAVSSVVLWLNNEGGDYASVDSNAVEVPYDSQGEEPVVVNTPIEDKIAERISVETNQQYFFGDVIVGSWVLYDMTSQNVSARTMGTLNQAQYYFSEDGRLDCTINGQRYPNGYWTFYDNGQLDISIPGLALTSGEVESFNNNSFTWVEYGYDDDGNLVSVSYILNRE